MIGDSELLAFRRTYYDLLVGLLSKEPDPELLMALRQGWEERARAARELHPLLGAGWEQIGSRLTTMEPAAAAEAGADEFTALFLGPLAPEVNPYESFYLTGKLLDRPLAEVRQFVSSVGIERQDHYAEPEDSLAFELEIVRQLIKRQASASDPDAEARWVNLQAAFLKQHLLVWAPACAEDLERAGAPLYSGIATLLRGFLALELELVRGWGEVELRSLDEARLRHTRLGAWKGPLFEARPGAEGSPPGTPAR